MSNTQKVLNSSVWVKKCGSHGTINVISREPHSFHLWDHAFTLRTHKQSGRIIKIWTSRTLCGCRSRRRWSSRSIWSCGCIWWRSRSGRCRCCCSWGWSWWGLRRSSSWGWLCGFWLWDAFVRLKFELVSGGSDRVINTLETMHTMKPFSSILYDSIVLASCKIFPGQWSVRRLSYIQNNQLL